MIILIPIVIVVTKAPVAVYSRSAPTAVWSFRGPTVRAHVPRQYIDWPGSGSLWNICFPKFCY